jgi:DNA invertase Pin-like site-specific DNA recombinase
MSSGESAKSLHRPGLQRLLGVINAGKVEAVIVAKLDRLIRSLKDLCNLLEAFEQRKVAGYRTRGGAVAAGISSANR